MSASSLRQEVLALRRLLQGGETPDPERIRALTQAIQAEAPQMSKPDLRALAAAFSALMEEAQEQREFLQEQLKQVGTGRKVARGYGCLRSASQGQRVRVKA
ncbi:MAG: hypothetical protein VX899_00735 [Myxococcota bacterium]|nr:hypothetical protein [Myxococcota bacterium]